MNRLRRSIALSLALVVPTAIVACSAPPVAQGPPKDPGNATSAGTMQPAPEGAPPVVETAPADPRVVRCGVDDRPKNVLGAADLFPSPEPRIAPSALLAHGFGLGGASKIMVAKPRPPSIRTVALARPRSSTLFESATRGGSPLSEPAKTASVGRVFDVSECIGEATVAKGNVTIQLRVASSGAPLEARPKTSDLDERTTHCVVELGCRLSLPATPATSDLEIRAALSQIAPVFKGNVSVSPSSEGPYVEGQQPTLTKLGQSLKPLAEECAKKHPPAATISFSQRLAIDDAGLLSLVPPSVGGATEALMSCLAPKLREGVGPIAPALRKLPGLRTSFTFVVSSSP